MATELDLLWRSETGEDKDVQHLWVMTRAKLGNGRETRINNSAVGELKSVVFSRKIAPYSHGEKKKLSKLPPYKINMGG